MDGNATVRIHFRDMSHDEEVQERLERRLRHLEQEFPEATHFELTLQPDSDRISASAHVTGKDTDVAAHANSDKLAQAGDQALDKLERELRRIHDKRIFGQRRERRKAKRSG